MIQTAVGIIIQLILIIFCNDQGILGAPIQGSIEFDQILAARADRNLGYRKNKPVDVLVSAILTNLAGEHLGELPVTPSLFEKVSIDSRVRFTIKTDQHPDSQSDAVFVQIVSNIYESRGGSGGKFAPRTNIVEKVHAQVSLNRDVPSY